MKARPEPYEVDVPDDIRQLWNERGDPVVKIPAEVLRRPAAPMDRPTRTIRELVDRMKDAMAQAHGIGLAAPQMGCSERVIIYRMPDEDAPLRVFVNPKIVSMKGEQTGPEGCLSMPHLVGDVTRAHEIVVRGMDMLGRPWKRRADDLEARVIQHEIDHLDGILFTDRAIRETLRWVLPGDPDETEEEEEAFSAMG